MPEASSIEFFEDESLYADTGPAKDVQEARPALPTQQELLGDPDLRRRDELAKDRRAVSSIVLFCIEGKPPVADDAKERFRRNEQRLLGMIATTGLVPRRGPAYVRLAAVVQESRLKTAEIAAASRLSRIGVPEAPKTGQTPDQRRAAKAAYRARKAR